ncbi:MAG: hypothetical protein ACOZNI_28730 [Myxococcota bacterium]
MLLAWLFACGHTDLMPVQGTTVRVAQPTASAEGNQDLRMHIFSDADECDAAVGRENVDLCLPFVDRSRGQVRVAFQMRVDGEPWSVPLSEENIEIFHKNQRVLKEGLKDYKIVPHDPVRAPQLFVLMIDATYSMGLDDDGKGVTRLGKVKRALLRKDVVDAFFPGEIQTAVVPLIFRGGKLPEPLMGTWIVDNKKDYRRIIEQGLDQTGGFTPLYEAIEFSASTALEVPEVKAAINNRKQQPTVIALTDGFNNPLPPDTCADNAPRLEKLLTKLDALRRAESVDIRSRPTVYTVGLGRKAWRGVSEIEEGVQVSTRDLCRNKGAEVINGGLERNGVDNIALSRIAKVGGGNSYISRTSEGLAEAFKAAAATRYGWFEARYKVDPFFLRRSFETKLRLTTLYRTEASIFIHPSGWLDAPPAELGEDGWATTPRFARTTTLVFPVLGLIAAVGYLPAALFNVRRALFSRVTRRAKRKG